jgi:AcrR family transcriptional regulator
VVQVAGGTYRPDLRKKKNPSQKRSTDTLNLILRVAGELLGDVGIERLSTNLICKRAGLTPPALYRYFPNKYAVLKELGVRLMNAQNDAYLEWLKKQHQPVPAGTPKQVARRLREIQEITNAVTETFPGAAWIMRALRAVPVLQKVRLESHHFVAERAFDDIRRHYVNATDTQLRLATRLSVEMMYAATEMIFDDPDLDADKVNTEVAEMIVRYFQKFS